VAKRAVHAVREAGPRERKLNSGRSVRTRVLSRSQRNFQLATLSQLRAILSADPQADLAPCIMARELNVVGYALNVILSSCITWCRCTCVMSTCGSIFY
jgi:hypothetical protein